MSITQRTRASALASLFLTIANPPPATATGSRDDDPRGPQLRHLASPGTGRAHAWRKSDEILDRLEL